VSFTRLSPIRRKVDLLGVPVVHAHRLFSRSCYLARSRGRRVGRKVEAASILAARGYVVGDNAQFTVGIVCVGFVVGALGTSANVEPLRDATRAEIPREEDRRAWTWAVGSLARGGASASEGADGCDAEPEAQ